MPDRPPAKARPGAGRIGLFVGRLSLWLAFGAALVLAGFVGIATVIPFDSAMYLLGQTVFDTALSFELSVIPLFVPMGFFASGSALSGDLYKAFNIWLGARRGGLGMATGVIAGGGTIGILIVVVVEMALITPPMGINVFVIKGMARDVPLMTIYRGVLPFVAAQAVLLALLLAFPEIALWLPETAR